MKGGAERAGAIAALANRARGARYTHVVATRDHHIDPGGHFSDHPDFRDSFPVHCVAGSAGSEFHPAFQPAMASGAVDEVFYKGTHSASKSGFEGRRWTAPGSPPGCTLARSARSTWSASPPTTV